MTAPSLLLAASRAPDARDRILCMAETMRERITGLSDGFTKAEADAYRDDAIGVLAGRPSPLRTIPTGRIAANAMVRRAHAIRRRISHGAAA